jgi:hypothetical protein
MKEKDFNNWKEAQTFLWDYLNRVSEDFYNRRQSYMERAASNPRDPKRPEWDDTILKCQTALEVIEGVKTFEYSDYISLMEKQDDN